MCLQALQGFAREKLLDEPTQGEIGNLSSENLASNMACGTFMYGILRTVLMTFLSLSGSTDLNLSIVADSSSTWSRGMVAIWGQ
jgi:hypothetical protein